MEARALFDCIFGNCGRGQHTRIVRAECMQLLAACGDKRDLIAQLRDDIMAITERHFPPGDSKSARFARAMRALSELDEILLRKPRH